MPLIPVFRIGIWNAWIFMTVFLLQWLLIRFINKDVYKKTGEIPGKEQKLQERVAGIIFNSLIYISFIYTIFLPFKLGTLWFYTGLLIYFSGLLVLIIATINFLATPTNLPVTKGLYRYSRHPLYFSTFIIFIGTGIATSSWVILIISVTCLIIANVYVASEERFCITKYGNYYLKYLEKTPRWIGIPKL